MTSWSRSRHVWAWSGLVKHSWSPTATTPAPARCPAFAAVPVRFEGVADSRTYTVFRIRPDDSDQGLNIRDLPGADEGEVLVTLPPGSAGIRRLPRMPALIGDSFWWLVETGDGIQGWAHSSFLTPDKGSITDDELVDRSRSVAAALASAESGGLDYLGLSRRVPVRGRLDR